MSQTTNISWTNVTWNIARGCSKVDADCKYCYMFRESMNSTRYAPAQVVRTKTVFNLPLKIKTPSRIFTSSLTDFFHPDIDSYRWEAFDIIRRCPQHTFQILTKRPERIMHSIDLALKQILGNRVIGPDIFSNEEMALIVWLADWLNGKPPHNVWLGASVGSMAGIQRALDLVAIRQHCHTLFLSLEPLHDPISLRWVYFPDSDKQRLEKYKGENEKTVNQHELLLNIDWVIIGGESGNNTGKYLYRPCQLNWIQDIVDQCKSTNTPVFVKQLGTHLAKELNLKSRHGQDITEWPSTLQYQQFPKK